MTMRMRLPGGTLKIKRYAELRHAERKREVPVIVVGGLYFVWWSQSATRRRAESMRNPDLAQDSSVNSGN